jgi:hypothetical protein
VKGKSPTTFRASWCRFLPKIESAHEDIFAIVHIQQNELLYDHKGGTSLIKLRV